MRSTLSDAVVSSSERSLAHCNYVSVQNSLIFSFHSLVLHIGQYIPFIYRAQLMLTSDWFRTQLMFSGTQHPNYCGNPDNRRWQKTQKICIEKVWIRLFRMCRHTWLWVRCGPALLRSYLPFLVQFLWFNLKNYDDSLVFSHFISPGLLMKAQCGSRLPLYPI